MRTILVASYLNSEKLIKALSMEQGLNFTYSDRTDRRHEYCFEYKH